jgi:hypothetical protein
VRIVKDHQYRVSPRQRLDLRSERFQRSLPPLLRVQIERGVTTVI